MKCQKNTLSLKGILVVFLLGAAVFLLIGSLPDDARASDNEIEDNDISTAVESNLLVDPAVSSHLIDIRTNDGIVTLSGSVENMLSKERAANIARCIKGVRAVVNIIVVKPVNRSDQDIRNDIKKALLRDPVTDSYEIDVKVKDRTAILKGIVDSWAEQHFAAQVAKKIKGVKEIKNDIKVNFKTDRPDSEIRTEIEARFEENIRMESFLITVNVKDGHVTLTGTVGSAMEKTLAYQDAFVAGVKSVDNNGIDVKWWAKDEMFRKERYVLKSDRDIEKAVSDAFLYDPRVFSFEIHAKVKKGKVTLSGVVDNLMAKRAAEQDSRNTTGVWWVKNHIKVRPVSPLSDAEINQNITDAFQMNHLLHRYDLSTAVINQKAFIYGTVDTRYERNHITDVVAAVPGVIEVQNHVDVNDSWEWKSDTEIKEDVESELFWSPSVDSEDVIVTVEDGEVTLEGNVTTWFEAKTAVQNAFEGGANTVSTKFNLPGGSEFVRYYPYEYDYIYY